VLIGNLLVIVIVCALLAALVGLVASDARGQSYPNQGPLRGAELRDALRRGGFVIFFRHGAAEASQQPGARDHLPAALRDCYGVERPLTTRGVSEVRAVGAAFRALGLPVGQVLASPACRSIDTAWYAFGRVDGFEADLVQTRGAPATVRRLLGRPPAPGTNTVIVGHVSNTLAAVNVSPEEGEALVFAPGPGGEARLVARVPVDGWTALSAP
jgi:phosphohistidine phosphatase SixA